MTRQCPFYSIFPQSGIPTHFSRRESVYLDTEEVLVELHQYFSCLEVPAERRWAFLVSVFGGRKLTSWKATAADRAK